MSDLLAYLPTFLPSQTPFRLHGGIVRSGLNNPRGARITPAINALTSMPRLVLYRVTIGLFVSVYKRYVYQLTSTELPLTVSRSPLKQAHLPAAQLAPGCADCFCTWIRRSE